MRTLETIIRLSTAHAKLRFSKNVETGDVDVVMQMILNSIFQENSKKVEPEVVEDEEMQDQEEEVIKNRSTRTRRARPVDVETVPVAEPPAKIRKVDDDQQVEQLFAAKPVW